MTTLTGDSLANLLLGGDANDVLIGRGGNDRLVGGGGVDTASYAGALAGYVFGTAGGALTVRDISATSGDDGTDSLVGIEKLRFLGSGLTISSDTILQSTPGTSKVMVGAYVLADGSYVVSWSDSGPSPQDIPPVIRMRHFDDTGHAALGNVVVSATSFNKVWPQPVIPLADGGFIVTWTSMAPAEPDPYTDVFQQRYDAFDNRLGGPSQLGVTRADFQAHTAAATLADGSSIVAWTSVGHEPGDRSGGIFAQHLDARGNPTTGEFRVNAITANDQYAAALAPLANGGYVAIWAQSTTSSGVGSDHSYAIDIRAGFLSGISLQRFDADDQKVGDEILVSSLPGVLPSEAEYIDVNPALYGVGAVTALAGGGFVVAFSYALLPVFSDRMNIALVHFDDDGNVVGQPNQQVAAIPGPASPDSIGNNRYVTLAGLTDGGYVAVWQATHDGASNIVGQRFDANDQRVGTEFVVSATNATAQDRPHVTALHDGGFLVTWVLDSDVHLQRYDAAGTAVGVTVTGTAGADILNVGDAHFLTIDGAGGNDQLNGGASDDTLLGGAGNDRLTGGDGNDWLDGGAGADRMVGGNGGDTYLVDSVKDVVVENGSGGVDAVIATIGYTLGAGLERLTLIGNANATAVGNALDNVLAGNAGNNILSGGAGADVMAGSIGNDTYFVDNAQDRVIESPDGGTDTVRASVSFTLADNVEHLTLIGTGAIDGTGNALANRLGGNSGDNVLTGGDGDDVLAGGRGRDVLNGGDGNDRLAGGPDADTLSGGAGHDVFVFNAPAGPANADHVLDFATGVDRIELSLAYFGAVVRLGGGVLAASDFTVVHGNVSPVDTHHVVYSDTTGNLYYNADGRGSLPATLVATLDGHPVLVAGDIHGV